MHNKTQYTCAIASDLEQLISHSIHEVIPKWIFEVGSVAHAFCTFHQEPSKYITSFCKTKCKSWDLPIPHKDDRIFYGCRYIHNCQPLFYINHSESYHIHTIVSLGIYIKDVTGHMSCICHMFIRHIYASLFQKLQHHQLQHDIYGFIEQKMKIWCINVEISYNVMSIIWCDVISHKDSAPKSHGTLMFVCIAKKEQNNVVKPQDRS